MSLAQALAEGLRVTVIGLIIVFSVLVILMLVMMAMKKIFYREEKAEAEKQPEPIETPVVPQPVQPEGNDEELVAVITAAIAASLRTSTYRLQVKSFRRIEDTSPNWNRAGRSEVIESRF